MATFTFRIPDDMAGHLNSGEVRSWLTQYLRNPYSLPPDPGSGYERVSLTLPRELVGRHGRYLRCSPSKALRRLAQSQLSPSRANNEPFPNRNTSMGARAIFRQLARKPISATVLLGNDNAGGFQLRLFPWMSSSSSLPCGS